MTTLSQAINLTEEIDRQKSALMHHLASIPNSGLDSLVSGYAILETSLSTHAIVDQVKRSAVGSEPSVIDLLKPLQEYCRKFCSFGILEMDQTRPRDPDGFKRQQAIVAGLLIRDLILVIPAVRDLETTAEDRAAFEAEILEVSNLEIDHTDFETIGKIADTVVTSIKTHFPVYDKVVANRMLQAEEHLRYFHWY